MGCDIHMYAEKLGDSGWELVNDLEQFAYPYSDFSFPEPGYVTTIYHGRNYDLFAILADVRNGGDINCIRHPRDLPDDVSEELLEMWTQWGTDAHSTSYFTLQELIEFDWGETVYRNESVFVKHIQMDLFSYRRLLRLIRDNSKLVEAAWKYINSPTSVTKTEKYTDNTTVETGADVTYRSLSPHFFEYTMEKLAEMVSDPDDIRIVFWFDN